MQVSPKAWTRKGQAEIAVQRKQTLAKEELKNGVVRDLAAIKKVRGIRPSDGYDIFYGCDVESGSARSVFDGQHRLINSLMGSTI